MNIVHQPKEYYRFREPFEPWLSEAETHAEAISAREQKRPMVPIQQNMKPYTSPAGPPFVNPKIKTLQPQLAILSLNTRNAVQTHEKRPSQVAINVHVNPTIEMKPNFRCQRMSISLNITDLHVLAVSKPLIVAVCQI